MKFSMLAIAGAALAAGVEGFSAVGPARSFGVRQVSVVLLPNGREMFVSCESCWRTITVVASSSARRAEPMKFPLAQDWNSHETIRLICEFTDDNQITSHAHSLFNLSSSIPLVLRA
jgi:hypothetical protein